MAEQPIPFGNTQESGDQQLAGASPSAFNVVVDGKGAVRRRPGLAAYAQAPTTTLDPLGVAGLYVTTGDVLLVAGVARHLFQVDNGSSADLTPTALETLSGNARPVFAENEVAVMIAAGDEIQAVDLASLTSFRLNLGAVDPPPKATHVIAHAQRLLANDTTQPTRVRYSKTGEVDFNEFPGRYILTAEAKPDPLRAIAENINEVWAFGATTTQLFVPDASSVYAPSKTLRRGIGAAYSIIEADESFAWFDNHKRFTLSDGRAQTEISKPIAHTLETIVSPSSGFGYRFMADQFDCLVWTFPEDGRTWCYQLGGGWSQWAGRSGSNWTRFPVNAHAFRDSDGADVVGLTDGRVCQLTTSANDDLGDPIVAEVTTGYLDRGTDATKVCKCVVLTLQRGTTSSTTEEPVGFLTWRDDGGDWEDPIPVEMGLAGDTHVTLEFRSLGVYRRRQWRLTFSGSEEWVLAGATETFEVGAN